MMKLTPALPSALLPSLRRRRHHPLFPSGDVSSSSSSSQAEQAAGASDSVPPLPTNRIVLGCGAASLDYLATVAAVPKPDDRIRRTSLKVEGGGNAGNALTSAARLGLNPRIISKVANDAQGEMQLLDLKLMALIPPI